MNEIKKAIADLIKETKDDVLSQIEYDLIDCDEEEVTYDAPTEFSCIIMDIVLEQIQKEEFEGTPYVLKWTHNNMNEYVITMEERN